VLGGGIIALAPVEAVGKALGGSAVTEALAEEGEE